MALVKQKGNMYEFVTHMWGPVKGKCSHDCNYCYMKRFAQRKLRLDESYLEIDNLKSERTYFVGSSTDMWANDVPTEWIEKVLKKCNNFPDNTYLFQSKNPGRFKEFIGKFPPNTILGTTIETNYNHLTSKYSQAPPPLERYLQMVLISELFPKGKTILSLEPIMDFDIDIMVKWVKKINPEFISIGANSGNINLIEPSKEKVELLIKELKGLTKVIEKDNLSRLLK